LAFLRDAIEEYQIRRAKVPRRHWRRQNNLARAKEQIIYAQGMKCDALFYIQKGKIKLPLYPRLARRRRLRY
jgi:CRP-like cAMP-binding protein